MTTPIEVRPLVPGRLPEFLSFFDHDAFVDHPAWSSCYCQYLHVDHDRVDWHQRGRDENRTAACQRVAAGCMQGHLAYLDGRPVGWCNAAPLASMEAFAPEAAAEPDAAQIGQIGCFVVAPGHRRRGVATALLRAACDGFRAAGLRIARACPQADARSDAQSHFGPLTMYEAAGFQVHRREDQGRLIMCLRLD